MKRPIWPSLVKLARRVRAQIFKPTPAEEVDEELGFHVEMRVRELLEDGLTLDEARRRAVERFGDIEAVKRACRRIGERRERKMTMKRWWDDLRQDVGYALRQIRRSPGFAAVAVVTLGLGIGANSAVFSVVNGVLLEPLPFQQPDRLVALWTRYLPSSGLDIPRFPASAPELLDYEEQSDAMGDVVPYVSADRTITGEFGDPRRLRVTFVGRGFFDVLGVEPAVGRAFAPAEEEPEASSVVVLSHDLWHERFGGDPAVVGRTVELDGRVAEVVGVAPERVVFPTAEIDAWLPLGLDVVDPPGRGSHFLRAVGRLAPGATLDGARAELETITAGWNEEFEHHAMGHFIVLNGLRDDLVGETAGVLWLLLGAVGLILVVACANVANLMLARTESREREVSVRAALGAGRGRLVRQFVTESLVLAGLGAGLGLALAYWGTDALLALNLEAIPRSGSVELDGAVLLFTGALALGTALFFGLAPALQVRREALASRLRSEGRGGTGSVTAGRLRRGLVVAEAAVCALVLVAAGLVGRSLHELVNVDPGVRTERMLTYELALPAAQYGEPERLAGFYERLLERMRGLPGVGSAAAVSSLPLADEPGRNDFRVEGEAEPDPGVPAWNADVIAVSPTYFETMGIQVLRGRSFRSSEGAGGPYVAVLNQAAADKYWPAGDALEHRIHFNFTSSQERPVVDLVGMVRNAKVTSLDDESRPQIYLLHDQTETVWGGTWRTMTVVLRSASDPRGLVPAVRRTVGELDPNLALAEVRTMEEVVTRSLARPRFAAGLLGVFGALALVLAVVGIYGVVSYTVARRTREIGVRMAMGADPSEVSWMVVREGTTPAVLGVGIGILGALGGSGLLASFLFRVSPTDPLVLAGIAAVLTGSAVAASWVPARRATRIQPTEALTAE